MGVKNIQGSIKTTIFGALLCLGSVYAIYDIGIDSVKYDTIYLVTFGIGTGFLFLDDKLNGGEDKTIK